MDGSAKFTVFAPTNAAFAKLGEEALEGLDTETLTDILLYHAAAGVKMAEDLKCKNTIEMANGMETRTKCSGGAIFQSGKANSPNHEPEITSADIEACNGVVHVIDNVVLPVNLGGGSASTCNEDGFSRFLFKGMDNSQRLLLRNGVIDEIPPLLCPKDREETSSKNVILVVGDGMGWEMVRSGAIAKRVLTELGELGCDPVSGECPNNLKEEAKAAFNGRTTSDYYTEGKIQTSYRLFLLDEKTC